MFHFSFTLGFFIISFFFAGCASTGEKVEFDNQVIMTVRKLDEIAKALLIEAYDSAKVDIKASFPTGDFHLVQVAEEFNFLAERNGLGEFLRAEVVKPEYHSNNVLPNPFCACNEFLVSDLKNGRVHYVFVKNGEPDFVVWFPAVETH
jgi:hypothetical protein